MDDDGVGCELQTPDTGLLAVKLSGKCLEFFRGESLAAGGKRGQTAHEMQTGVETGRQQNP